MGRVLIAGCGYVGSALGAELVRDGHEVFGLRRRVDGLPQGVVPVQADLSAASTLDTLPDRLDFVLYLAGPSGREDAFYRAAYVEGLGNVVQALDARRQRPKRVLFASSTGVYAQAKGEWVDEESPTEPTQFSGRRLLEGEELLLASPFAATVVRFAGIYGPRRTSLIDRVRTGSATFRTGRPHYTNRIHRDDCVGALRHLMGLEAPDKLYIAVDSEPASESDVLRWLAGALGAPPPRSTRESGPRLRGNKRCRNARLLATGYELRYPSFRDGYTALLAEGA
ncbi:MAG: NAD-dependent epimerase/dehydratase family protein [Myxococcota bacterium]|nr:NAD-dependent epimerase/dehydratase family protein [Myxococcota bacterium]